MMINSRNSMSLLLLSAFSSAVLHMASVAAEYQNVYGGTLESCSQSGYALTGYTRSGSCVERSDDSGSHHICIDLSSIASSGDDFCTVTGQSDWCSSSDMACHDDSTSYTCDIANWCVCQWAFATYIEKAGGCDAIQDIQCAAINKEALVAYSSNRDKYEEALNCLVERCELGDVDTVAATYYSKNSDANAAAGGMFIGLVIATAFISIVAVGAYLTFKKTTRSDNNGMMMNQQKYSGDDMTVDNTVEIH